MQTGDVRSVDRQLSPEHERLIRGSAITCEVEEQRGYRTITKKSELKRLGFSNRQCLVPALLIPIRDVYGEIANYQIRPDQPGMNKSGKPVKYETPAKTRMVLDIPPSVGSWIGDPKRPLFITEGIRKADSAASQGLCCIALLGVWNWRGSNELGGTVALPDWESFPLNGRQTFICFDSDVMLKPEVHQAMARLKAFLEQRGADVNLIYLPTDDDGAKVSLDDYFAAGHTVNDLLKLSSPTLITPQYEVDDDPLPCPYSATSKGLIWNKRTIDGEMQLQLTNFTAKIISNVLEDDGVECRRSLEIEANLGNKNARFTIPTVQFANMNWAIEHLGANAVMFPGFGTRDHTRTAIQLLSGEVPDRRIYTTRAGAR